MTTTTMRRRARKKYNLLDLLNIIMYIRVYAQASRFSMACVGVAQRERPWLIAGLPIELRTAQHVQHKLSLLCHLAFAVLAHLPFSVPAINGTINCFQLLLLQSQSGRQRANNNHNLYIKHIKDKSRSSAKSTLLRQLPNITPKIRYVRFGFYFVCFCFLFQFCFYCL